MRDAGDGDRLFYLNDPDLRGRRIEWIVDSKELRLSDVIRRNTSVRDLPRDVFFVGD